MKPRERNGTSQKGELPYLATTILVAQRLSECPYIVTKFIQTSQLSIPDTPTRLDGRLNHSKLRAEVQELLWTKRFGQNVCNHVVCGNINDVAFLSFHEFADEMVTDVNMFDPTIMSRVNRQEDSTVVVCDDRSTSQ